MIKGDANAQNAWMVLNEFQRAVRPFTLDALKRNLAHGGEGDANSYDPEFMDHPEWYRSRKKPYRAAAIVAHLYGGDARVHTWADSMGLQEHLPPIPSGQSASWYWPGHTWIVCYTRPGVIVRWFKDRLE